MKLTEYLHFVSGSRSLEELWVGHIDQMGQYGFDRLIYGYTRYKTETSLGDPDDFVILSNHSSEYLKGFMHTGLYFHAPMTRWALENEGACSWRQVHAMDANRELSTEGRKVIEFNKRMGMTAGYTISFHSISRRFKGAISLAGKRDLTQEHLDEMWLEHGEDITLINNITHLKILSLPYSPPNRGLTKRQREALQWVGDGKTTQDIAILMGLTSATVEKHLRLARDSLSVETTAQAVLKAALLNQMFVMEA
ncbi:LuxR family transcriptional regulator [Parasedimentitalea marina]|uniref:LuxR family transcriptional regulator n=1 Tax=Parasedimentitalea marina TaxID=2483033 RepID=A0A3T0N2P9_9RHOB|nr:autoinducer binding domain-containing protein [Parasedimentitalea marina]AZV78269.1 LuxR family transcriptional regulator [Parasedimentitalea marina]